MDALEQITKSSSDENLKYDDPIGAINEVQKLVASVGFPLNIDLPQIAVVGGQSTGKSSLLERFIGKEILPRGENTVTRRPIVVQMIPDETVYGEFAHKPGHIYTNFEDIKNEIISATEEVCKENTYSSEPLTVSIHSPEVLKLTVVDLPGLIIVKGRSVKDESSSSSDVQTVRDMVRNYISNENVIILAVAQANVDILNAASLAIAEEVDPEGLRTIGVLTMIDEMPKGTNARSILTNKRYPLARGWIGVVNRNPIDTRCRKDMDYILLKEREFFESDIYKDLKDVNGCPYLRRLLHTTLKNHIKEKNVPLRTTILERLSQLQEQLKQLESTVNEPEARKGSMTKLINNFIKDIDMNLMGSSDGLPSEKFTAGATIKYILETEVKENISSLVLVPDTREITRLIMNHNGIRPLISLESRVVIAVIKKLVAKYKIPLKESVTTIKEILEDAIKESASLISPYPSLKKELLDILEQWIKEEAENTCKILNEHIECDMNFPNLIHPDFDLSVWKSIAPPSGPLNPWAISKEEWLKNEKYSCGNESPTSTTLPSNPQLSPVIKTDVSVDKNGDWHDAESSIPNQSTCGSESRGTNNDAIARHIHVDNLKERSRPQSVKMDMERIIESSECMRNQADSGKAIVLNYLKIVRTEVLDLTQKTISCYLVKRLNDRITNELGPTVMYSDKVVTLIKDYEEAFNRRREELKNTCAVLDKAARAIQNL